MTGGRRAPPDHPVIRNLERTGFPDGRGPALCRLCADCGGEIWEGELYYDLESGPLCIRCAEGRIREAERDGGTDCHGSCGASQ